MRLQRFGSFGIAVAIALCSSTAPLNAQTNHNVALVIGNGAYRTWPALPSAANDATLVAAALQHAGFELVDGKALLDLDKPAFVRALHRYDDLRRSAGVSFFYYAGHAQQSNGRNYLAPVDVHPAMAGDIGAQLVSIAAPLGHILGAAAGLNVLVLDASHENPFAHLLNPTTGGDMLPQGLASIVPPPATLVAFAMRPDRVELQSAAGQGLYAKALVAALSFGNAQIVQTFNRITAEVSERTRGAALPWFNSTQVPPNESVTGALTPAPPGNVVDGAFHDTLGDAAYNRVDYVQAIGEYQRAVQLNSNDIAAHLRLATIASLQANWKTQLDESKLAVQVDPQSWTHSALGFAYVQTHDPAASLAEFRAAVALDPTFAIAQYEIGNAAFSQKNYDVAEQKFRLVTTLDPYNALAHDGLGRVAQERGNNALAVTDFQTAIALNPRDAVRYVNLASAYYGLGRYADAQTQNRIALGIEPNSILAHNSEGAVFFRLRQFADANTEFQTVLKLDPGNVVALDGLASVALAHGDGSTAALQYRAIIAQAPANGEAHAGLCMALRVEKQPADATPECRTALQYDPNSETAHLALGALFYDEQRYDDALVELIALTRIRPVSAQPHNIIGAIYFLRNNLTAAESEFKTAIALDSRYRDPHQNLAKVYRQQGRSAEAAIEERLGIQP